MREGIKVEVNAADRVRLDAIVAGRTSPQKYVWLARIVLLTADGLGTSERRVPLARRAITRSEPRCHCAVLHRLPPDLLHHW